MPSSVLNKQVASAKINKRVKSTHWASCVGYRKSSTSQLSVCAWEQVPDMFRNYWTTQCEWPI